ncbi:DUF3293 domain-containing protein [Sesbania bispinosa]|nr:DUF3293 domain-containing protein [Sesbania bispinosa]
MERGLDCSTFITVICEFAQVTEHERIKGGRLRLRKEMGREEKVGETVRRGEIEDASGEFTLPCSFAHLGMRLNHNRTLNRV